MIDNHLVKNDTVVYPPKDNLVAYHNIYYQSIRAMELAANGLQPEMPALKSFDTMRRYVVAKLFEIQ